MCDIAVEHGASSLVTYSRLCIDRLLCLVACVLLLLFCAHYVVLTVVFLICGFVVLILHPCFFGAFLLYGFVDRM